MTGAAIDADPADDGEHDVLGRHTGRKPAVDDDLERLRLALQQALRGQHVADFGGADAKGEGAECAVRAGMAVAADDGLAGLRGALFGPDDVHDAAARVLQPDQVHAELGAVHFELAHLPGGRFELDRQAAEDLRRVGRCRVVHRRERAVEPADLELAGAQDVERLGGGDFVRQVQVDIQDRGRVGCLGHDDVPLPHFLEQALRSHSSSGRSFQTAAAGDVSFWSAPRRREDSMALITSMKARTPDSTMSVVTLVPR